MDKTFKDACFIVNLRSPYFKGSFFFSKQSYKKATRYESIPVKVLNSFNRLNRTLTGERLEKKLISIPLHLYYRDLRNLLVQRT